jgi:hypothetical protein
MFGFWNCILNADGAPFDSFVYVETVGNEKLLLAFQMKLSNASSSKPSVITLDTVNQEFNKINDTVSKFIKGTDFVLVVLGNCDANISEENLPSKSIVISREEHRLFYGDPYYRRFSK